eukprot:3331925-Amphidinium_carterae.1
MSGSISGFPPQLHSRALTVAGVTVQHGFLQTSSQGMKSLGQFELEAGGCEFGNSLSQYDDFSSVDLNCFFPTVSEQGIYHISTSISLVS